MIRVDFFGARQGQPYGTPPRSAGGSAAQQDRAHATCGRRPGWRAGCSVLGRGRGSRRGGGRRRRSRSRGLPSEWRPCATSRRRPRFGADDRCRWGPTSRSGWGSKRPRATGTRLPHPFQAEAWRQRAMCGRRRRWRRRQRPNDRRGGGSRPQPHPSRRRTSERRRVPTTSGNRTGVAL
jgi:hypothetical protein